MKDNELREAMDRSMKSMENMAKNMLLESAKSSMDGLPDEINIEEVKQYNELMAFYKEFKIMIHEWAKIEDARYAALSSKIDSLMVRTESVDGTLDTVLELQRSTAKKAAKEVKE